MKATRGKPESGDEGELNQLVERIQHLKQEHAPLVSQIGGDAGMSAALRRQLLDHLNEEESEVITQMAAISPQVAARYRPSAAGPSIGNPSGGIPSGAPPAARKERSGPAALTVGSLRNDAPTPFPIGAPPRTETSGASGGGAKPPSRARLSIGSLRSR